MSLAVQGHSGWYLTVKDTVREYDEASRPEVPASQAIRHCLDRLFADDTRSHHDEVVPGLSFEELIGALLLARDLAQDDRGE